MRHLKYIFTLCAALLFIQGHATEAKAMEGDQVLYSFFADADENGWLNVTANLHNNEVTFGLPAFEEWSYNSRKQELCFVVDTSDRDRFMAIAVYHLPEGAKWSQLMKDHKTWFCTCGGEECDCELIELSHREGYINLSRDMTSPIGGDTAKRLDETIWDKDKVEDKETGEVRFEGPICKTTMIKHGRLFYLIMSRYKGSAEQRLPEFEALHDRIANSTPARYIDAE